MSDLFPPRPHRRKIPPVVRARVYRRSGHRCEYCGLKFRATAKSKAGTHAPMRELGMWLELDHIKPYSEGGTDDFWNLRAACSTCNRSRGVDSRDSWADRRVSNAS